MTDVLTGSPAPAWYPDPAQGELLRWWDGSAWSVHTMHMPDEAPAFELPAATPAESLPPVLHTVPQSIPEPMPFASGVSLGTDGPALRATEPSVLGPIERAARAEIYAKLASTHANESVPSPATRPGADPFGSFSSPTPITRQATATQADTLPDFAIPSSTIGGWLLAFSPWLGVGALGFHTFQLLYGGDTAQVAISVGYVVAGILPLLFAGIDRAGLRGHGHVRRPSWWWMILGPLVYFIVRTVALSKRSRLAFIPLGVWVGNALLAAFAGILLLPTFIQGVVETEAEKEFARVSAEQGLTAVMGTSFDVRCPDGVLVPPFRCNIRSDSGFQVDLYVAVVDGALEFAPDESTLVVPNSR